MGLKHLSLLVLLVCASLSIRRTDAALAPAFFVLGDSTVDTGNQDYITTVINSDYPPYGKDFVPPGPTGRFSNGKLANDFIGTMRIFPLPLINLPWSEIYAEFSFGAAGLPLEREMKDR